MSMSAGIVSQEKSGSIVHTCNEKTQALFQAARKELLFPAYATLSTVIVVSEKGLNIFLVYIYSHRKQNKENRARAMSSV